jgi:hypothetical protein
VAERVVALALLLLSGGYLAHALAYPVGTTVRPGPGFFPVAVGVFAVAVALGWVALSLRRATAARAAAPSREDSAAGGVARIAATSGLLVFFCLAVPWAGYPATAFIFVGAMLRRLGLAWAPSVAIGIASAVASYYLFAVLLGVPLPRGVWLD